MPPVDLRTNRLVRLALRDRSELIHLTGSVDVCEGQKVAPAQLAVDRQIGKGEITDAVRELAPEADRLHVLGEKGAHQIDEAALVPSRATTDARGR